MSAPRSKSSLPYILRSSPVHGTGLFATRDIRKGTRIIEYLGERISHAEAENRYSTKEDDDAHTFLFTVDRKTVIDAGVNGNDARFINHSCEPSCEVVLDNGRLFIYAIQPIKSGQELAYDYNIARDDEDPPGIDQIFGCRCGTASCRGTMLEPKKKPRKPAAKKKNVTKKPATKKKPASSKKTRSEPKAKKKPGKKAKKRHG